METRIHMKIFIITYIDLDKNGGQATHLREVVNNLSKLNGDVTLLCPKFDRKDLINCSKIVEVPGIRERPTKNTIILQGLYSILMVPRILRHKIDVVYIRHSPFNILPLLVSKIMGTPCIIEVNYSIHELKMLMSDIIIFPIKIIDKLSFNLADGIVAVADDLKGHIHKDYNISNEKIFVIPNGADIDVFRPILTDKAKELSGLDNNSRYICYVGGLKKWQGIEFLVKSAPAILEKEPNTKFLIIGRGNSDDLINLAKKLGVDKKFIFIYDVPHESVPIYINVGDICVAPFCKGRIASPIKIYEYMACGKPIVASDISGIGDLLEKSFAGVSVPPNDVTSLSENIVTLLKDDKLRDIMGKNARKYIIENCTWNMTAKRVLDVCTNAYTMEMNKDVQ